MNELSHMIKPKKAEEIIMLAKEAGFVASCDDLTGSLLSVLASSKPRCKVLELGTGVGYSTSWLLEGMDHESLITSVEIEDDYSAIAKKVLGDDKRVAFVVRDGGEFIQTSMDERYDLIFADTWPGKFYLIEETLGLLNHNGVYVIDDLNKQPNWRDGHAQKVEGLIAYLNQRDDLNKVMMNWSTGLMIITKKK